MKLDRLKMHQEWFDRNQHLMFLESRIVMQELLAMTREARNQRDEIELMCKRGNILETLIVACLYEGISGVLRSDGTTNLVDGGCGCCSDRPKYLTEEQKALIADILKRNKK
jgi:hypothetical protein